MPTLQTIVTRSAIKAASTLVAAATILSAPLWVGASPAVTEPGAAPLSLAWEPEAKNHTRATLTIGNTDRKPLPASGWSIFFNCDAGVQTGDLPRHLRVDGLGGTFYRLYPVSGFGGLAAGQALQVSLQHLDDLINISQAPIGPYLVQASKPNAGLPIHDYKVSLGAMPQAVDAHTLFLRNVGRGDLAEAALPPVLPTPLHFARHDGSLRWATRPSVVAAASAGTQLDSEIEFANQVLDRYYPSRVAKASVPPLHLDVSPSAELSSPEAYSLTVNSATGVAIVGNSAAGVARGVQSLRALLPADPHTGDIELPAWEISDAPRFAYRGLQLDVARNFQRKEVVIRILDLMARFKLNTLHLHLTDDEGWRLEIVGIPELTGVGARRGHSAAWTQLLQPAYGSGPAADDPHGSGFYRRTDFIAILQHAAALRIEVIPEIEMPGHARAAVKAMTSRFRQLHAAGKAQANRYLLDDPRDRSKYSTAQYYTDNVMDPGVSSTYTFVEHVLDEVVAMYREAKVPLHTIHVGGDELPGGAWEQSPSSLALMKQHGMQSTADLWNYFYDRVDQMLRKRGLFASGWEELGSRREKYQDTTRLEPNPAFTQRGFHVYAWNDTTGSEDLGYRLAAAGYPTVLAPASRVYLDMMYNRNPDEPGARWQSAIDLDTVFDFLPAAQKNILGLEGQVFTETMREPARIDYMLMPRMLALAERAWAPEPVWTHGRDAAESESLHRTAWSTFVNQVGKQVLPRLDSERDPFNYRIPPPGLEIVDGQVRVNMPLPGFTLRYTVDDHEPNATSAVVAGPIAAHGVVQVAAFNRNGRMGHVSHVANR